MFRKALETLIGASLLVPMLAGCFAGGGGGSDSNSSSSVSMTLADPSNPAPSAFRFTLTGMSLIASDDTETTLFPPASDPLATTAVSHESYGGAERFLGEYQVPSGTYRAVRFQYQDAEAGELTDPRPIVPALADLEMAFAQPFVLAAGAHQNVRLVFDLEHSLTRAGQAFLIDPLVFADIAAPTNEPALSEFLAKVTGWDATARTLNLRLLHPTGNGAAPAEYGDIVADVPTNAVLTPASNQPFVASAATWLDDFLGASPQGQWLEILGFLQPNGNVRVQSADVRAQNPPPVHVQVEGIIAQMGSDESTGLDHLDVDVTSVESGDATVIGGHPGQLRFAFSANAPPSTHVGWTGAALQTSSLFPGVGVELQGYVPEVGTSGPMSITGDSSSPGHTPDMPTFVVTNIQVKPITLSGTLSSFTSNGTAFCIVDVERIAGGNSSTYPSQVAVALYDSRAVFSDATIPMPPGALYPGQEMQIEGYFTDAPSNGTGTPHHAGSPDPLHPGPNPGHIPGQTHSDDLPIFVAINISARGAEFEGETISAIDPAQHSFYLTGDGSDFGYPDPTTIRIQTQSNTRIVTDSTAGRDVGVSTSGFYVDLPFAHTVSVRGYLDRSVNPPVLTASWLRAELP
ncbi:MAG: hypothetical protein HYR85_12180 [Planctomycetes bacterium]|nr:hypothetical protein [Planctomycetota bacterium]MBI3844616.1 hypothetical protein [Planctomycetota bacterium]